MQHAKWSHFIAQLAQLRRQRQAGMALLRGNAPHDATVASLESVAQPHFACPNCHSSHAHRHGHAHGPQRYRCVPCGRTVNLRAGIRMRGATLVQNVNDYHSRLREWLRPFHDARNQDGRSASSSSENPARRRASRLNGPRRVGAS